MVHRLFLPAKRLRIGTLRQRRIRMTMGTYTVSNMTPSLHLHSRPSDSQDSPGQCHPSPQSLSRVWLEVTMMRACGKAAIRRGRCPLDLHHLRWVLYLAQAPFTQTKLVIFSRRPLFTRSYQWHPPVRLLSSPPIHGSGAGTSLHLRSTSSASIQSHTSTICKSMATSPSTQCVTPRTSIPCFLTPHLKHQYLYWW
jgi:hypothetical protein